MTAPHRESQPYCEDLVAMARAAQHDDRLSDGALYGKLADEISILKARGDIAVDNRNYWQAEAEQRSSRIAELEAALRQRCGVQNESEPEPLRELIQFWMNETRLQTFEDRQRFRKAAREALALPSADRAPERPRPKVVAAVQQAIMKHPHFEDGPAMAFGLANTAIDAYRTATSRNGGSDNG